MDAPSFVKGAAGGNYPPPQPGFLDPRPPAPESHYRYMAGGTGSLPFLGGLYGSGGNAAGGPMGASPSPYRTTGATGSGLVNTRTFWPPTPPPEAYSRCSVGGSYYPMFSSMSPMVPPSDLTFSCANLLPRISANPFTHLLGNHKDTPFLPLRLNSPVTPNHPLSVPHLPYLHLPTPSLDQCYPSTPGLYSPLTLHSLQDSTLPRPAETEVKPDPECPPSEVSESGKRPKASPKVTAVKGRRDEKKSASPGQHRKVSIPVMTATVSPCNVATADAKCSKCSADVDDNEESKDSLEDSVAPNVVVPVSQATVCSTTSTAVTATSSAVVTQTPISESQDGKTTEALSKPMMSPQTELVASPRPVKTSPAPQRRVQSPPKAGSPCLSTKRSPTDDPRQSLQSYSPLEPSRMASPFSRAVETTSVCTFSSWVHHQTSVTSVIKQDLPESDSCLHAVQSQMTVVNLSMDKDSPKRARSESTVIFQMQNTHNAQCRQTTEEVLQNRASKCTLKELPVCANKGSVRVKTLESNAKDISVDNSVKGLAVDNTTCVKALDNTGCVKGLVVDNNVCVKGLAVENAACVKRLAVENTACVKGLDNTVCVKEQSENSVHVREGIKELPIVDQSIQGVKNVPGESHTYSESSQQQAMNLSVNRTKDVAPAQQGSVPCDIKKASGDSTRSLDALSKLAKCPPGLSSGLSSGSGPWKSTNRAKPSSVVSSIQSENFQSGPRKISNAVVTVSSSPICQPVMSNVRSDPVARVSELKVNEVKDEVRVAVQSHDLLSHATCSSTSHPITNPIMSSSVSSSIPVGIAVAQLRHDSSTVSIKKAIVKANNVTNKTLPYSVPAMIDKADKRFIKTAIAPVTDTTMIVNPTPTLNQWDSGGAMVRPATLSGSWLTPAQPVVTPTVWLGSSYPGGPAQAGLGSLVEAAPTTNALVPPVGYHLARDPMTGHLYLIPAPNIDIVDRSNVWSTYTPNAVQQVISHFPTTINGTKKELKPILTSPQLMEKTDLPIIQPRLIHTTDQTMTQDIKDMKSLNTAIQSSVTSITVQTGQPFTFPGFTAAPQPTLSYFYDQPTIVHIAQAPPTATQVQPEPGKRSQGTSPLNSMTPSPLPHPCTQTSECESDIESLVGSENSNKGVTRGVTASCQVDMDNCSTNSNDIDYEERAVEVFDSANQTDTALLESYKEEESSSASLILKEDSQDIEEEAPLKEQDKEEDEEEEKFHDNTNFEEEEVAAPVLPTESKPVIDFIDQHGLNLLVDSIEEFASRENQKAPSQETISISRKDDPADSASKAYEMDPACTDGLGLLCALAEQRFLEESKNDEDVEVCRARSCSPDLPYGQGEMPASRTKGNVGRSGSLSSSRCQSPVLLNPAELEMRFKLAELQRRYKMKQKELAKLKPRKDRDSSSSEGGSFRFLAVHESLEENMRKKNRKSQSGSRDPSPIKHRSFSDATNYLPSTESVQPVVVDAPEMHQALHSPTFNPFTRHTDKPHHQVFPNLVKISAKKAPDGCDETAVSDVPIETESKTKPSNKKKDDKKNNKSLFQLWKEKKLAEELSKGLPTGKKCNVNRVKMSDASPKKKAKVNNKSPIGHATTSEEVSPPKEGTLKRTIHETEATTTAESESSPKHMKLENVNNNNKMDHPEPNCDSPTEAVVAADQTVESEAVEEKQESSSDQTPRAKKREKRSSSSIDDIWSRRRSERIFLHDAGVILPSSLAYTGRNSPSTNNNNNNKNTGTTDGGKSLKDQLKKKSSKKDGTKKLRTKDNEKQNHVPLEMFLALRQCRLSELGLAASMALTSGSCTVPSATSSQEDSSGSEGDVPLSMLLQMEKKNAVVPDLPPCQMQVSDLRDCQRVLMEEDDLYYAGYVTAIQAPDVYGITLDRERGNRPHIFSREEMLQQTVKEVKPVHVKQIPEGTRVCAYWSQQYRCLYPGTVTKGNSEEPIPQNKNTVFVEFDDGDSGRIPLEDVRLLVPDQNPPEDEEKKDDVEKTSPDAPPSSDSRENDTPTTTITTEVKEEVLVDQTDQAMDSESKSISELAPSPEALKAAKKPKLKSVKTKSSLSSKLKKSKLRSDKNAKSNLVKKIKNRLKKKSAKKNEFAKKDFEEVVDVESISTEEKSPTHENENNTKSKKVKAFSKLDGKKISKLKNSFILKKAKHHFSEGSKSSILQKIKSTLKKSRKNKKTLSEDMSVESCESSECKSKKRKKHKTDHKHHHHHHKKHCHHHHKKKKRKSETGSPTLSISVGPDLSSDEAKMDLPICCVSPGRSELSVKITATSPTYNNNNNGVKSNEIIPLLGEAKTPKREEDIRAESNVDDVFQFPDKCSNKSNEKAPKSDSESKKETTSEPKSAKKRKERKISCEKSKIAAFLPARQLWRWSGKSFRRPGTKGKAKKEYFKAITRGKETIRVGDCAVFLSTGRPHLPYVGRIETLWQSRGGNTVVKVKWFYHPEETKGGKKLAHPKGALFQSPHVDENDVQTISHKCEVLSWANYQKWCEGRTSRSAYENEDVYYLAGNYEPLAKILTLEPGVS